MFLLFFGNALDLVIGKFPNRFMSSLKLATEIEMISHEKLFPSSSFSETKPTRNINSHDLHRIIFLLHVHNFHNISIEVFAKYTFNNPEVSSWNLDPRTIFARGPVLFIYKRIC